MGLKTLSSDVGKSEKRLGQNKSNCNNVCRFCQINLKVTYGKCVAKACANTFKPAARKEIFGVVLIESLKSFGITVIAFCIRSRPVVPVHVSTVSDSQATELLLIMSSVLQ